MKNFWLYFLTAFAIMAITSSCKNEEPCEEPQEDEFSIKDLIPKDIEYFPYSCNKPGYPFTGDPNPYQFAVTSQSSGITVENAISKDSSSYVHDIIIAIRVSRNGGRLVLQADTDDELVFLDDSHKKCSKFYITDWFVAQIEGKVVTFTISKTPISSLTGYFHLRERTGEKYKGNIIGIRID